MSGLSRRTFVRAGVTTAWTAPIVVMAVPASAAACSGGLVQLAAEEVAGSRVVTYDGDTGALVVEVTIRLTNSGVAGSLVSASVSGTNDDALKRFTISRPGLGVIGTVSVPGSELILTVTASPSVPLAAQASQDFRIEYTVDHQGGDDNHTINVSFQPDCGAPAICPITANIFD